MVTVLKIPKQIQIGGHTYKVFYKPYLSKDDGNRGGINHRKQVIFLNLKTRHLRKMPHCYTKYCTL